MTADLWLPGAIQVPMGHDWGPMDGTKRRACIVHTTEGDSIAGAEAAYKAAGFTPTMTWDPRSGEVHQHIPATTAASAILGGRPTQAVGTVCIQIETVGYAAQPFTDPAWSELKGWDSIHAWLQSWGIPDVWPGGPPLCYPKSAGLGNGNRSWKAWAKSGYFGHSQAPLNDHGDPGCIDTSALLGGGDMDQATFNKMFKQALDDVMRFTDSGTAADALNYAQGVKMAGETGKMRPSDAARAEGWDDHGKFVAPGGADPNALHSGDSVTITKG